jgi:pimeloyl-ACP methyl ester carboxylesterase
MQTALEITTDEAGRAQSERVGSAYYKTLVRSGYAPINGLQMYYEIHGTVTDKPLVTIHPFLGVANVFPSLARGRQLIAIELQAHGRTADIDRPITFEQHADDVAALLNHLDIERADLFGESFGGTVAMQMAVRHPRRVRRVAVYGAILGPVAAVVSTEALQQLRQVTPEHRSVEFQRENYLRVAPDPANWPTLFGKSIAGAASWKGLSREELRAIDVPVLIAAGDHEALVPSLERQLEVFRTVPHAQFVVIPDAGHFVLNHDPERVLPIIAAFLDEPVSKLPFATTLSGYHPGETR